MYNIYVVFKNIIKFIRGCGGIGIHARLRGFGTMIKFLNDFDKAEYSLGSLNDFKNKNTG